MDELNKNENKENVDMQNQPKNYALGTLGAFIGAFVASIPWILMYVYGNMILAALSIIVAIGALKGYQLFKGTIDKKLPIIISIASIVVIIFTTLIIIPALLIMQEGYPPLVENIALLYSSDEFLEAIIHDLIISIIFTVLGISGVVSNVNRKIKESNVPLKEIKISDISNNNQNINAVSKENIKTVKDVFLKYDALSKQNAIDKNTIFQDLTQVENGKQLFNTLKMQQIIRKYKGNYYFSEKAESSFLYRFIRLFGIMMFFMLIFMAIMFLIIFATI